VALLSIIARVVLAIVFAIAAVGKALDQPGTRRSMRDFGAPAGMTTALAVLLPALEAVAAGALVVDDVARPGALLVLLLLGAFTFVIVRGLRRGEAPDCHCFGQFHSAPAGRHTVLRNAVMALLALSVLLHEPATLAAFVREASDAEVTAVLLGALLAGAGLVLLRLHERVTEWERELEELKLYGGGTLVPRSVAPEFAAVDAEGREVTLDDLPSGSSGTMLIFVSPDCGPCAALLPSIARWQRALGDVLAIEVLTSAGEADQARMRAEFGIRALREEGRAVSLRFKVSGTPTGVHIGSDGRIANPPAEGAPAIEAVIRQALASGPAAEVV
jgi:thiol-disulfide isomerase/thioredoxin